MDRHKTTVEEHFNYFLLQSFKLSLEKLFIYSGYKTCMYIMCVTGLVVNKIFYFHIDCINV